MARTPKLPLISVIVCCYNGAAVLGENLDAIRRQKWDGKLELIVVDDCSSDDTAKVAKAFKAKVIRNKKNLGCAGSRNVGIAAAKGDIIAFSDDDCRPKPTWLKELYAVYAANPEAMAVGGPVEPHTNKHWLFRYLAINNPLGQLELSVSASRKPLYRIKEYLKGVFGITKPVENRKRRVYSLPGANFSFRKEALAAVDGFDGDYPFSGEDQDVCRRINAQFDQAIWFAPKAKVLHAFKPQLGDTLRRSRAYGKGNAHFADKYPDISLVIFPFPLLVALVAVALGVFVAWWSFPLAALLVPILYPKWLISAVKNRSLEHVGFAYINFLQEVYGNVGLLIGLREVASAKRAKALSQPAESQAKIAAPFDPLASDADNEFGDETPAGQGDLPNQRLIVAGIVVALLALFTGLEFTHSIAQAVYSSIFMLTIPGYLLLRTLRVRLQGLNASVFAVTSSVGMLILESIVVNTIGGFMRHPHFSTTLFVSVFDACTVLLLAGAWLRTPYMRLPKARVLTVVRTFFTGLLLLILPLFGAFATAYLNHSGNNTLSMVAIGLAGALAFVTLAFLRKLPVGAVAISLYAVSVTIILMGAGRGAFLSGTDVSKEFYLFTLTQHAGHWSPSLYHDAYNACLSINLLPVMLQSITKLSDQAIFRVVIPALYALMPIGTYALLRKRALVGERLAYIGALFVTGQQVFLNWAAVPIRQMVCLLFFNALLLVIFSKQFISRRARAVFILLFGVSMILSHYSTTYMALGLLITAYIINRMIYLFERYVKNRTVGFERPILGAPLLIALLAAAWLWYTPVTHTSNNITHLAKAGITQIREGHLNLFASNAHSEQSSFLDQFNVNAKPRTTTQIWTGYLENVHDKYDKQNILPLVQHKYAVTPPHQATPTQPFHVPAKIGHVIIFSNQALNKLSHVFMGVGLLMAIWALWKQRKENHEFTTFSLGAAVMLVLVAVVPYASITYDLGRTSQQMLPLLALPTLLGGVATLRFITRNKISYKLSVATLGMGTIVLFLFATGWVTQLTGGVAANKLLNNTGTQYKAAVQTGELTAATWLGQTYDGTSRVYSGYYARNRLWLGGIDKPNFYNDILPWTIDKYSYVYEDADEIQTGYTTTYYNGSFINYQYPTSLLNTNKNLIYSDGQANIYK